MRYVGIDLSLTATGVYIVNDDDTGVGHEIKTKPADFASDIQRADHIASEILTLLEPIKGDLSYVALEGYFTGMQAGSVIKLAILGTVVRCRLLDNQIAFIDFAPTQIKKFETGKGNAPKDNILKSVYKNHGFDTNSNNVADACAIAHMNKGLQEHRAGKNDFFKYQLEVFQKLNKSVTYPYQTLKGSSK